MMDGNCNMRDSDLQHMLNELTLKEILLTKHGPAGPATSKRNTQAIPIDGMWTTPGIHMEAGGYFKFDEVMINTDHRICGWTSPSLLLLAIICHLYFALKLKGCTVVIHD